MDSSERMTFGTNENGSHIWERCSVASSTSTASNLPGPGRALDNLYGSVGRTIEAHLGRLAEKFGRGPRMAAVRIERRRSKVLNFTGDGRKARTKTKKVVKDCKKLVGYVQSNMPSTQMQALEQITRLSVQDPFVRDTFLDIGAQHAVNQIRSSFLGAFTHALLPRTRKALLSLTETEVNTIGHEIRTETDLCRRGSCSIDDYSGSDRLRQLKTFLSDPDRAWLVIRHLHVSLGHLSGHCLSCLRKLFDGILSVIVSLPEHIEWSTLDYMIERFFRWFSVTESHGRYCEREDSVFWASLLEFILRFADRLPHTTQSNFFVKYSSYRCTDADVDPRLIYLTYQLLRNLANSNCLDTRESIGPDYTTVARVYNHSTVQPLLRRITCPPEVLLGRFVWNRYEYQRQNDVSSLCHSVRMLDPVELEQLCKQLSEFMSSEDELIRQRTLHAFTYLLTIDLYSRNMALQSLSSTPFAGSRDFQSFVARTKGKCVPHSDPKFPPTRITRHLDNNKVLLHLEEDTCDTREGVWEVISLPVNYVRELRLPRGSAFSARGVHAINAGNTLTGDKAYIALPVSGSGYVGAYVAITEGSKPEDTCVYDWEFEEDELVRKKIETAYLAVYMLRYAPEAYPQDSDEDLGMDATGPFSWRPLEREEESGDSGSESTDEDVPTCGSFVEGEPGPDCSDEASSDEDWASVNEWESVDITNE